MLHHFVQRIISSVSSWRARSFRAQHNNTMVTHSTSVTVARTKERDTTIDGLVFVTCERGCEAGLTRLERVDVESCVQFVISHIFACQLLTQQVLLDRRQVRLARFSSCAAATKNMSHENQQHDEITSHNFYLT